MIPEKGKTYKIDYWFYTDDLEERETFYKGLGTFTGNTEEEEGEEGEILYQFDFPDNAFLGLFAEDDIIEEVKDSPL